jgi:hypothetical protein
MDGMVRNIFLSNMCTVNVLSISLSKYPAHLLNPISVLAVYIKTQG